MRTMIKLLIGIITILVIAIIIAIYFLRLNITGLVVENYNHTYTQAICNETLEGNINCTDYEIVCNRNQLITANIIKSPVITHEKNWQDPRGENGSVITCE